MSKSKEMQVRIIKEQKQAGVPNIKKADTSVQLSKDEQMNAGDWIHPEMDMRGLKTLTKQSSILPQCIRTYKNNICGFGIGVRYIDDSEETKEMSDEFNKASEIIELLNTERDTKSVFEDLVEARETYGIAYLEVIRNIEGDVVQIEFIKETPSITKTRPLDPYIETPYYHHGTETIRAKRFCKYKQDIGGLTVYFKEFGDPRTMDRRNGTYLSKGESLDIQYQANEILEFAIGTEPYGEVRWIGQILGVDGSRKAENLNNNYFENGRHTPLMIMIEGGTLSEESYNKLQSYMNDIKGEAGQHAFIVLETESTDGRTDFDQTEKPKVEIKDLANILQKDELFQDYLDNNRRKVQSAFQLPDLYVGYTTDFNRATAQTAREVTDEQVFQPERRSLAWTINNRLLNGYKFRYVEAYFMEPDITNPDDLFKLLSVANQAGGLTPNKAKDIVYEAIGDVAEPFPEEWGEVPLALKKQQNTGNADVGELMMQMRKQIAKAENNHDDEIVAVMKEVKNLLQSRQNSDIIKVDWNEEDHPRDDHGSFTSGGHSSSNGEVSANGENTFSKQDFISEQKLNNHYNKHVAQRHEYDDDDRVNSKEDYKKVALDLVQSKTGGDIFGHIDKDGYVVRYDKANNDFVKGHPDKGVFSMYKPEDGADYYEEQKMEDIEHGGKA